MKCEKWMILAVGLLVAHATGAELTTEMISPMHAEHLNGGAVAMGGKLFVWSGINSSGGRHSVLEIYDPTTDSWTLGSPFPSARNGMSEFVLDGRVYSVGGEGPTSGRFNRDVYEYQPPPTDTWRRLNDYPTNIWDPIQIVCEGRAFLMGGRHGYGASVPNVYEYDQASDTWIRRPDMPYSVRYAGTACVNGQIYVLAGLHNIDEATDEWVRHLQIYDLRSDTWTILPDELPRALSQTQAATAGSRILLFAGHYLDPANGRFAPNGSVDVLESSTGDWDRLEYAPPYAASYTAQTPTIGSAAYVAENHAGGHISREAFRVSLISAGQPVCGDGICQVSETTINCPGDCTPIVHWSFDSSLDVGHDDSGNGNSLLIPGKAAAENRDCDLGLCFEHFQPSGPPNLTGTPFGPYTSTQNMTYPGPGGFTVAFWALVEPGTLPMVADYWQHVAHGEKFGLKVNPDQDRVTFEVRHDFSAPTVLTAPVEPFLSRWTHFAGVYEPQGNTLKLYINGTVAAEGNMPAPMRAENPPFLYTCGSWHQTLPGCVDDVRIYSTALASNEVERLSNSAIFHWSFDDSSAIGHDDSGHGHSLTIPGAWSSLDGVSGYAVGFEPYQPSGPPNLTGDPYAPYALTDTMIYPGPDGFTVAFWALVAPGTLPMVADYWQHVAHGEKFGLKVNPVQDRVTFEVRHDFSAPTVLTAPVEPFLNRWTHFAGVYEPQGNTLKLYINGTVAAQGNMPAPMRAENPPFLYTCGSWHQTLPGAVDEVWLFDRALSAQDIRVLPPCSDCDQNGVSDLIDSATDGSDCDANRVPDECQVDADGDGHIDLCDNCPDDINPDQADCEGDGVGDACDLDIDDDGIPTGTDDCECNALGITVDDAGRPIGDIDRDCDTDLEDYGLLQINFSGPAEP